MDRFDQYELEDSEHSDGEWGTEWSGVQEVDSIPIMEASFQQLQHSNIADDCGGLPIVVPGNKLSDLNNAINKITSNPEERFKRHIGAITHSMSEDGILHLSVDERNRICRCVGYLDNVKYLNATAFILGFFVSGGGRKIDKNRMAKAFDNLRHLNDDSVKPPDVVRYSRHWMKISPCPQ